MKRKIQGLQFIVNTDPMPPHPHLDLVLQAVSGGVDSIQFRHKGVYTRDIYLLVCQIAEICDHFSVPLIINDRIDIALAISAAGVHLGQGDLPIKAARNILGEGKIIGLTASTLQQAKQAEMRGADYIGFGHIYPTKSKVKRSPPTGLPSLKEVCSHIGIPILAIGGIQDHNLKAVCQTGVKGVAVISAISFSSDPLAQTQKFKQIMSLYETDRVICG